ncbi:hypothetical protein GQ53DRAFT_155300 [Thozetella sp. PMI_491]|nr:hypothetical protein GQ53DRAFT_155300 [Thozetella sp. PMI_491]
MDAKPQRAFKYRVVPGQTSLTDENMIPSSHLVHDRLKSAKSTSNLKSTMNITGAMNVAPKRAAFGDLSNASNALIDIGGKDLGKNRQTLVITRDTKPADKENPTKAAGTKRAANASVVPALGVSKAVAAAPSHLNKQVIAKKTTIVFHDQPVASLDTSSISDKPVKNPRHYKSQPYLKAQQPVLRRTQSKQLGGVGKPLDVDEDLTEAVYEDAVEQLPEHIELAEEDLLLPAEEPNVVVHGDDDLSSYQPSNKELSVATAPSEPEEYWDDEDDQEQDLYDEQGFTTAHSYRSHGDNTTGGPTTMIAPKATESARKELEEAKNYVLEHQTEEEIEEEAWDVSMVAEYGDEIFEYMTEMESRMLANPHYMDIQTEIQWSMRSVLMDWLVQVHHRFGLLPETLFLTVNYIDRFLSVKVVSLGKLQLVGATAIFVAAKYEEINCPSIQEIIYMVDQGYTVEEILKAERFMLAMLNFELGWPGPMSFLRRISKADDYDLETRTLAKYFLEVTIMDERFVGSTPSFLAAGAHCLARMILGKGQWTPAHVHYSGYVFEQLKPLVTMILECCQDPVKHHRAVYEKYCGPKFKEAATYVKRELKAGFTLDFHNYPWGRPVPKLYCPDSRRHYLKSTLPEAVPARS